MTQPPSSRSGNPISLTTVETDCLNADAKNAIASAYELGNDLRRLGDFTKLALSEVHEIHTTEALSDKAARLRCVAAQGHVILNELVRQSGRLEALGSVRCAARTNFAK